MGEPFLSREGLISRLRAWHGAALGWGSRQSQEQLWGDADAPPVLPSSALCIHPRSCSALPGRSFTHTIKQSLENDLSKIKAH